MTLAGARARLVRAVRDADRAESALVFAAAGFVIALRSTSSTAPLLCLVIALAIMEAPE